LIPRFKPDLGWPEFRALFRCNRSAVEHFEKDFAAEMGQKHAISFPYGRMGLLMLLEALGLKDKAVICPAYTCVVVAHAIVLSGNRPVFVDSQVSDCNMDLELAERAIGPETGAIIATSIFGHPVDLDRLDDLSKRNPDVIIIQDCAHSFAAEWQGRPVQQAGRAAVFGLNISKIATSVFGGMVTTDDDALAATLRQLRDERQLRAPCSKGIRRTLYLAAAIGAFSPPVYGLVRWLERSGLLDRFSRYYDEALIDMPADALVAMTSVEAQVGIAQLVKYRAMIGARRRWAAYYRDNLANVPGLIFPQAGPGATWSHIAIFTSHRDALLAYAQERGVQLGTIIDYSIPEMSAYRDQPNPGTSWPVAASFARTAINLPISGSFCEQRARKVVDILRTALEAQ